MNLNGLEIVDYINSNISVILASGSPRRSEILSKLGINFNIVVSNFEENLAKDQFKSPSEYVMKNAHEKISRVYSNHSQNNQLIIGADTIVVLDSKILEKPLSESHAHEMLSMLNGKTHSVVTALVIYYMNSHGILMKKELLEETIVEFGDNSQDLLDIYIKTQEPMDKAGGYGYQGLGGFLVKSIRGDYYNVVGFPSYSFLKLLSDISFG